MNKIRSLIQNFSDKTPNFFAAVILSLGIVLFLLPAIITNSYFIRINIFSTNFLDTTGQILPWFTLSKEILFSGHLPLWNDLSGMGLPLLANMQSAVFFPLSWFFFLFDPKLALLLFLFIKLFLTGFFSFLFARQLKLSFFPSILSAIAITYSGAFIIWPQWTLSNVVMLLPIFLWAIQKSFITKRPRYALIFAPLTALGIFAGHPQTLFYIYFIACCWIGFLTLSDYKNPSNWKILGWLILSGIVGVLIASPALLPFLEYLKLSANINYRSSFALNPFSLSKSLFISNLIPDFFGNPGYKNFSYLLVPNYSEITMGYVGLVCLILAIYGLIKKNKIKAHWFFIGVLAFCFSLVYRIEPIYYLFNRLPGFNWNYNNRLLYVWSFCVAILGAFGLQDIFDRGLNKKKLFWTLTGTVLVGCLLFIINRQPAAYVASQVSWDKIDHWQKIFFLLFFAHLAAAGLAIYFSAKKPFGKWLLLVFVFFETAIHGLALNRITPNSDFYPQTPVLTFLSQDYTKNYSRAFVYGHVLLPNIATQYGFNELSDYDVMYLTTNKQLKKNIANYNYSPEYTFDQPNLNALKFFSARWLIYPKTEGGILLTQAPQDVSAELSDEHYELLELKNVFPRAFLVQASNIPELETKLKNLISNPDLKLITPPDSITYDKNGDMTAIFNANNKSYFVSTDNFYPGWTAQINGANMPLENVMGLRVLPVQTGTQRVTVDYHPKSLAVGFKISLTALSIWLLLMIFSENKAKKLS